MMRARSLRMGGLIDNVLDFARGRLGGGINISRDAKDLGLRLEQVTSEICLGHPHRQIDVSMGLYGAIAADHARMAQMFSNLLDNAVTYGDWDGAIRDHAAIINGHLDISVANGGDPIPMAESREGRPMSRIGAAATIMVWLSGTAIMIWAFWLRRS
ncbi:MAG: hypothetical protein ACOH2L_16935 [Devosia sp.]